MSHLGMRMVQISVRRSFAKVLQDLSAGGRKLQRREILPALLLTGRDCHNVPVHAQFLVSCVVPFLVASVTTQGAISDAVPKEPVQM